VERSLALTMDKSVTASPARSATAPRTNTLMIC
jgi:hypothetical protein